MRRILATLALAGASALSTTMFVPSVAQAEPSSTSPAAAVRQGARPGSDALQPNSRCKIWWKITAHHSGYTAGYSWAWKAIVQRGDSGDRVREIQCLTDYYIGEPAALDGIFGPATEDAVEYIQYYCNITEDGIVGPDTWHCLRKGDFL